MNRKTVVLNLALLALAVTLAVSARKHWNDALAKQRRFLSQGLATKNIYAPTTAAEAKPVTPADYVDVAQKMLFSRDRNPTVVIEPPPPKPEPKMPDLPSYHGQMAIGDPVILLSLGSGEQKSYHAGDGVGDFKLIGFDREKVALEWQGKKIERSTDELRPKEGAAEAVRSAVPSPPPNASGSGPVAVPSPARAGIVLAPGTPLGPPVAPSTKPPENSSTNLSGSQNGSDTPVLGPDRGFGFRDCVASDKSPDGTVFNGYKKTSVNSMFGPICHWEQVR